MAKAKTNETFIVQASLTIVTYDHKNMFIEQATGALHYKDITIVNDDSSVVNKFRASLIDAARVIIYDRRMFIVQATGLMLPPGVRE